jgi:GH35 family endo-1,4-beta-xylanase
MAGRTLAASAALLSLCTAGAAAEWTAVGQPSGGQHHSGFPLRLESGTFGSRKLSPRWERPLEQVLRTGTVYELEIKARALHAGSGGPTALKAVVGRITDGEREILLQCGPVLSGKAETFTVPFIVGKDVPAAEARIGLIHGFGPSAIEVGEVRIRELGSDRPLNAYTRSGRWYEGQEADAGWRRKADHRTGTFSIEVIDDSGQPLPDARVIVEQQKHAYRFGTAVNSTLWKFMAPGAESNAVLRSDFEDFRRSAGRTGMTFREGQDAVRTYFETLKSDFNYVVFENALKWQAWSGDWGGFRREDIFELIDWLHAQEIEVKGHALVWPDWRHSPNHVKATADRPEQLNRLVHAHITEIGHATAGKVAAFDVLNEAFSCHDYMDVMGREVVVGWFRQARSVLPDVQLNVNEFLLLANGGQWSEKLDFQDRLVGELLAADAPLDAIGFQSHFRHTFLTSPLRIWELCDRFGRHGLPLVVSEFDVNLPDEKLQAQFTRDFLTAWFAHPSTTAFTQWGFWQGSHWLPYGGLYDLDWRMKPNAEAYRDLVFNLWWTGHEEGRCDARGRVELEGFLGTYRVSVHAAGKEKVLEQVELGREGTDLTVRL